MYQYTCIYTSGQKKGYRMVYHISLKNTGT